MTRGACTTDRAVKKPSSKAARPHRAPKTVRKTARSPIRELNEALQREAATAEILNIISSAPNDTQPVFDAIVSSGLKLFPQALISIALSDGHEFSVAAIAEPFLRVLVQRSHGPTEPSRLESAGSCRPGDVIAARTFKKPSYKEARL